MDVFFILMIGQPVAYLQEQWNIFGGYAAGVHDDAMILLAVFHAASALFSSLLLCFVRCIVRFLLFFYINFTAIS